MPADASGSEKSTQIVLQFLMRELQRSGLQRLTGNNVFHARKGMPINDVKRAAAWAAVCP